MNKIWRPLVDRLREFIFCILKAFEEFSSRLFFCVWSAAFRVSFQKLFSVLFLLNPSRVCETILDMLFFCLLNRFVLLRETDLKNDIFRKIQKL